MRDITPITINYGMNDGLDLLWINDSCPSRSSFPEQDIYIPNLLLYNFLLVITQNDVCDAFVESCIIFTKAILKLPEDLIIKPGVSIPMNAYGTFIQSYTDLVRPVTLKDNQTIHIGLCTTDKELEYWLIDGKYVLSDGATTPAVGTYTPINTSTDSVIPLYIYGIR